MLKLTLYLFLAWCASIPVLDEHLLPGSEPNQWGVEEVEVEEEWIWIGNRVLE